MPPLLVTSPANFVPQYALAFGAPGSTAIPVDAAHPLPIYSMLAPASVTPIEGTAAAPLMAGPFVPVLGRTIWLTLSGTWAGSVQLLRSIDGGAIKQPLTVGGTAWAQFEANCNEAVAEESEAGASYYLQLTPASGTISYRVSQ